jgi:hypothetical protein
VVTPPAAPGPAAEPVTQPAAGPVTQPAAGPAAERAPESVAESAAEPVAEPVAPPGKENVPAPGAEDATGAKGAKGAKGGKGAKGKGADGEEPAEGGAQSGEAPAGGVTLHMPEPPSGPSPATKRRIGGVQARAGKASKAHGALPDGKSQVGDAEKAVSEPEAEANAKAQQVLMAQVQAAPSPEIENLCERIRDVIANKRPPDEDALAAAEPDQEAAEAGSQLNATVEGETKKVQGSYAPIDGTPTPGAPKQGQEAPPQPGVGEAPPVGAQAAVPDAVPAENVSLDKDAEESRKKAQDAGMNTAPAQLVQSGPVAEARSAQGELDQVAKEDPAKVMAGQQEALTKAEGDMAALQARTLAALEASRAATATGNVARQGAMVGSEESMRAAAAAEAQKIFSDAKTLVTAQLKDLPATAMAEWDAAKVVLAAKFKADLKPVQDRVAERHSGAGGFVVGLWDAVTGLPDWAEEGYTKAETAFGDGVIAKLREISTKVNAVIIACDLIITDARTRIAKVFSDLPESMGAFAEQERAKFDGQLDRLHDDVAATRDNFNKELIASSSAAVDEVRAEIAELRKKAGGLIGRIVNAINRFIDDPVKFIIEGLLDLLGIPPAAFWAVVAKIKKVIGQIADDPLGFANNLLQGLADGFGLFFSNFGTHLLKGFLEWLLGGVKDVQVPKDVSLKSIVTFFLQLMGITWPNIRKILVKLVGAKNVALVEKVYSMVSLLIEKGPEGIYEMIKEKLDPAAIVDQVVQMAVEFMVSAIIKQVSARIIMLFNPAGAILQALEAIYRVLKWVFQNAAKIFTLVETVVNGIADILAGNTKAFAAAVEKGLAMLIAPVISFIADYLSLGDLPSIVADKVKSMREWVLGMIESALTWLVEKGKALLAAVGIGKKDDKKKEHEGTPHQQAVKEVADTLAVPDDGDATDYDSFRAKKEAQAAEIEAVRNPSLAAENVRMTVTFADRSTDQEDHDLDFTVTIAPNTETQTASAPTPVLEPIAGTHTVVRPGPKGDAGGESHHVPAKGLGSGVGRFLMQVAAGLRSGEWKGDPAAEAVAAAFEARATENLAAAAEPGKDLSAILLSPEAHTAAGGVHTVEGAGPVLLAVATNPAKQRVLVVRRRTLSKIGGVATYLAVNPQIGSWLIFIADARRMLADPTFTVQHNLPPSKVRAADEILDEAEREFMDADEDASQFLEDRIVKKTNQVLYKAVGEGYRNGKATVANAMERVNYGTPSGRAEALASLDGHFGASWAQFRDPIDV